MSIKKIFGISAAAALLFLAPIKVQAIYVDDAQAPLEIIAASGSWGSTFNLLGGYNPATDTLTDVMVDLLFWGPRNARSNVSVQLDLEAAVTGQSINFGAWGVAGIVFEVSGTALSNLRTFGTLDYKVSNNSTFSIILAGATLSGDVTRNANVPTNVPDGGATLVLLGCSLVGLGMFRRAFKAA